MPTPPNILFITGTDTGVGKTTVGCLLAARLRRHGVKLGVHKPVETGCVAGIPADGSSLLAAAESDQPLTEVVPSCFAPAVAPAVAAERSGARLDLGEIVSNAARLAERFELLLVEGAGGVCVPLSADATYLDFAERLKSLGRFTTIVVVGSRLGCLNHTMLTLAALRHRAIPVLGYVVNQSYGQTERAGSCAGEGQLLDEELLSINRLWLKRMLTNGGGAPSFGELATIPFLSGPFLSEQRTYGEQALEDVGLDYLVDQLVDYFNLR